MTITTRAESKRRHLDALAKSNTGWGVGDTISYLVRDIKSLVEAQIWISHGQV